MSFLPVFSLVINELSIFLSESLTILKISSNPDKGIVSTISWIIFIICPNEIIFVSLIIHKNNSQIIFPNEIILFSLEILFVISNWYFFLIFLMK